MIGEYIFDIPLENVWNFMLDTNNHNKQPSCRSAFLDSISLLAFLIACGHCLRVPATSLIYSWLQQVAGMVVQGE